RYRAFHSSEVPYMFGSFGALPERRFTPADHAISERMLDYWANFVKFGNPNGADAGAWPRADVEAPVLMELGDRFGPMASLPTEVSVFWNRQHDTRHEYAF